MKYKSNVQVILKVSEQQVNAYNHGLVQDCSNSSALAVELLQSYSKPQICDIFPVHLYGKICHKSPYNRKLEPGKDLEKCVVLIHGNVWEPCHLTHWGQVTHIFTSKLCDHWFRQWLVACSAPSHYLNQCRHIVNSTLRNVLQRHFICHGKVFI